MNAREHMLAAIRHQVPDRIPVDAIAVEGRGQLSAFLGVGEDEVLETLGLDGRAFMVPYAGPVPEPVAGVPYNAWGVLDTGDYGTAHPYPLAHVTSVKEVEEYAWPNAAHYDVAGVAAGARAWSQAGYAVRGPHWKPLFSRVCELVGMEDAMVMMLAQPLLFDAIVEQIFLCNCALYERLLDACGDDLPILCTADDFATQRGLMISPDCWRKHFKPRYARLFALGKERGKFIWFHACGDISAVLPDLIDIGMDIWETVQLHTLPLSPQALKREYGQDITFFGGINTQRLPFIGPDQVRDEVRRCIDALGEGGGYICGPDHHIKPDVPPENTLALFEAARSYSRSGYTGR